MNIDKFSENQPILSDISLELENEIKLVLQWYDMSLN